MIDLAGLGSAAVTFALAIVSVALWTVRVALASAGRRLFGAAVAGIEALTFALAFSRIVTDLDNPLGLFAYAAGVGVGTLLGLAADERFSPGQSWVRVIVEGNGQALCERLLAQQWPVTCIEGTGPFGPITELLIAVDDTRLRELVADIDALAPEAFRTIERLRSSRAQPLRAGLRQVRSRQALGRSAVSASAAVRPRSRLRASR